MVDIKTEESKIDRTTIELLKEPDIKLLRNLKASLTLKFNTDISYRNAILYLFVARVLGSKSVNEFLDTTLFNIYKNNFSKALEFLINHLSTKYVDDEGLWQLKAEVNDSFEEQSEIFKDDPETMTAVDRGKKEFAKILERIEKAKCDELWKVE